MGNSHTYSIFIKCLTTGKGGGSEGKEKKGREKEGERGENKRNCSKDEDNEEPNHNRLK